MEKRQIVNIINFIRGVEPRYDFDLVEPIREQIKLLTELHLRGTFLIQYDALQMPEYVEMLKALDPEQFEIGVWHEIVQPEVEAVGLKWRGIYPWDWHVYCGFPMGYTKKEREMLVDELFASFHKAFGYYPRVFGSWFYDSHTVRYITEKYGLDAMCNCKEQYGTDGYTLWGGYYGQGYYPSRNNIFVPAQTKEEQISVPIFRMLGSDPVYQYDYGMSPDGKNPARQGVITLEPAYVKYGGGGVPAWVDWYLKENYNGDCLTFGYAQAGQENSFGWEDVKAGLNDQYHKIAALQAEGKLIAEPLGETGRWYKKTYDTTPASAITAHTAFDDAEKNSVWYCSRYYRVNLYEDHGNMRVRDLHVFSEQMADPFEDRVCEINEATYESLPLADGNRHSGNGVLAGLYLQYADGRAPVCGEMTFEDRGNGALTVSYGNITWDMTDDTLRVRAEGDFTLCNRIGKTDDHIPTVVSLTGRALTLSYAGVEYTVTLEKGRFADAKTLVSEDGEICARFC